MTKKRDGPCPERRAHWYVGTSGFSYRPWRGSFYPADLPAEKMLGSYAGRLPAVEINNTFYRLPAARVLEGWSQEVPPGFRFAFKAPRRITHLRRLKGAEEETATFFSLLRGMGDRLGPVLFQLPPTAPRDVPRLEGFLQHLPTGMRAAFEFRHESWLVEEVFSLLARYGSPLCLTEDETRSHLDLPSTASWGYLRLRRLDYDEEDLADRMQRLIDRGWEEVWLFFKHEDEGRGPRFAARFLELLRDSDCADVQ